VLGLGVEQTSQVMQVLKELSTTIRVVGSPTSPRLVFDTKGLTKEFQDALVKAGKERAILLAGFVASGGRTLAQALPLPCWR
jgi:hypothetical protein